MKDCLQLGPFSRLDEGRRHGFTMLELLIVIGIIAILITILLPAVNSAKTKAKEREAMATARALENAITAFKSEYGYWPCPDPNVGGTFNTVNDQSMIINNYLVMDAPENSKNIAFWETRGCVTNWSTTNRLPFSITIDVTNNTVTVQ